eukprot:403340869
MQKNITSPQNSHHIQLPKDPSTAHQASLEAHKNFKTVGHYTIDFGKFLGSGKYGKVYNAFYEKQYVTGQRYACKVIELGSTKSNDTDKNEIKNYKNNLKVNVPGKLSKINKRLNEEEKTTLNLKITQQEEEQMLQRVKLPSKQEVEQIYLEKQFSQEVDTLKLVNSKHVIKVIKAYKTQSRHYLITELCNGGDLSSLIKARQTLPEDEAIIILKQIIQGLMDMGLANIIHRDLKLANILLHFPNRDLLSLKKEERVNFIQNVNLLHEEFEIKISDFGFAKVQQPFDFLNPDMPNNLPQLGRENTICGTPAYMSPDQIIGKNPDYSDKFDIWSLGAIYYELLVGCPPFIDKSRERFERKLREGNYEFPEWCDISPEGIHFISRCLQYQESTRASIAELAQSLYLPKFDSPTSKLKTRKLQENYAVTSLSTEVTLGDQSVKMKLGSHEEMKFDGSNRRQPANSLKKPITQRKRLKLILNSKKQYTLAYIIENLTTITSVANNEKVIKRSVQESKTSSSRNIGQSQTRSNQASQQIPYQKHNSFGSSSSKFKMATSMNSRKLTERATQQKYNQILLDSDLETSTIINKSNDYELVLKKMMLPNYFK